MIGPFRASRTKAAVGIPDQPNVFYIGAVNGGVWKTTDYGRTWKPIFDDQPTGSIGAIAIAPSNPNIIYVGSGEGLQRPDLSTGDGIYKSTDAGKTWTHLGLRDGQQIPQIVVDPRDPNRLFVAVHGPSVRTERRARAVPVDRRRRRRFRKSYIRTRIPARSTSCSIPSNPNIVYCALWEARQGPWENGAVLRAGQRAVQVDRRRRRRGRKIGKGLPTFEQDGLGRIGITVAPSMPSADVRDGRTRRAATGCIARTTPARTGIGRRPTRASRRANRTSPR